MGWTNEVHSVPKIPVVPKIQAVKVERTKNKSVFSKTPPGVCHGQTAGWGRVMFLVNFDLQSCHFLQVPSIFTDFNFSPPRGPEGVKKSGMNFETFNLGVAALVCLVISKKLESIFFKSRYKK